MNRSRWGASTEAHSPPPVKKTSAQRLIVRNDQSIVSTERMNFFPLNAATDEYLKVSQRLNAAQKMSFTASNSGKFEDSAPKPDDFPILTARKPLNRMEKRKSLDTSHALFSDERRRSSSDEGISRRKFERRKSMDASDINFPDLRRRNNDHGISGRGVSSSPKPPSTRRRMRSTRRIKPPIRSKSADDRMHDSTLLEQSSESISDFAKVFSEKAALVFHDEPHNNSFPSDRSSYHRGERYNSSFSSDVSSRRHDLQNNSFSSEVTNPQYDRLQNSFSSTGSFNNIPNGITNEPKDVPDLLVPGKLRVSSRDTPSKRNMQRQSSVGTSNSKDLSRSTLMTRYSSESKSSSGSNDQDQDFPPRSRLARTSSSDTADKTLKSMTSESNGYTTARRSRRPKALGNKEGSLEEQKPLLQSANAKLSERHPKMKKEEYLNRSFNWSFSSVNEPVEFFRKEETDNDTAIMTPSLNYKPHLSNILNFEVPTTSMASQDALAYQDLIQPVQDAISVVDEEGTSTLDEVSEAKLTLYEYARRYDWDMVLEECQQSPWTAKYVGHEDGTTALHLAVMSRANPQIRDGACQNDLKAASLQLIEQLIIACPESAIIRCTLKKYTPLCYACLVAEKGYDMDDSANMIRIILKHSPHSALVFTDEGFSALDVHIISYSRLFQEKEEVQSRNGRSSTVVLRALLQDNPSLALSRSYGNRVRGPVELLYRCNLNEFKEASGQEIVAFGEPKKSSTCSVLSTPSQWWAWKWTLTLLEVSSQLDVEGEDNSPFLAVHAAAQLVGCPVPILALSIDAFPEQVKQRSPRKGFNNCPLHDVCGWISDSWCINGDPVLVKRKKKAISLLLEAFPKAARMTNNLGETPLHLAIETCSPWETLDDLVRMFPAALTIPRNIENCREDSPLFKAMAYHNEDLGSVGSDEWEPDAIESVQGMYPFMVAAVLSLVPDRRMNDSSIILHYPSREKQEKGLQQKDLESLRSIYGLLRSKPLALELFIEDEKTRIIEAGDRNDEKDETEDGTEAFLEENATEYTEEEVSIELSCDYTEEEVE